VSTSGTEQISTALQKTTLYSRYFTAYPKDADKVVFTVKSGAADMKTLTMDGTPEAVRKYVDRTNVILDGKKKIDVFGCGRVDPNTPIEETVGALAELVKEGKINMVEAEVCLWSTDGFENGVAETCAELGTTLVAHTPLGAGMLTGQIKSLEDTPPNEHQRMFPRS
jgi:pyridoxine 4-dehydrogenase